MSGKITAKEGFFIESMSKTKKKKTKSGQRLTIEKLRKFLLAENAALFVMLLLLLAAIIISVMSDFGKNKSEDIQMPQSREKKMPVLSNAEIVEIMGEREPTDEGAEKVKVLSSEEIMKIMNRKALTGI